MSNSPLELVTARSNLAAPPRGDWHVGLHDPARSVMTDFNEHGIVSVPSTMQVDDALEVMRHAGVRSAFVLDEARASVLGLVTAYDIMGEKPLRHLQLAGGGRGDVVVSNVMDGATDWRVARITDVDEATVRTILQTFQKLGRTHLPVVEDDGARGYRLRGVFSAAKVLRLTELARRRAA
jgi:CBS domain-containing protein